MTDTAKMTDAARAMAHPVRMGVLLLLRSGPMVVHELTAKLGTEPTSLSKHLSVLRESGLVVCDPQWRCRRYSLSNPQAVKAVLEAIERLAEDEI